MLSYLILPPFHNLLVVVFVQIESNSSQDLYGHKSCIIEMVELYSLIIQWKNQTYSILIPHWKKKI